MKVAFVMPTYFDPSSVMAGGERYAYGLAKAMSKKVHVTIFTFSDQNKVCHDGELTIVYCKTLFRFGGIPNPVSFGYLKELRNFDVIHCLQFRTLSTELAILIGAFFHKKVFVTDLAGGSLYCLSRFLPVKNGVQEFLYISEYNRNLNRTVNKPSRIIYGGVDIDFFSPNIKKQPRYGFLYVGRIFYNKGIHDLIQALPEDASLEVVGQCHDPEYLQKLKKMSRGKQISFYDSLPDRGVVEKYRNALAVVLPSLVDGGFTSAMEAMACGTPVIGTRVGSLPEIVLEEKTGFLVPPQNPDELGKILQKIQQNRKLVDSMGSAARADVLHRLTWEKVTGRCLAAYSGELP